MRKLIIRHFALDCWVVIFGVTKNFPRAARMIMPCFLLMYVCWYYSTLEWLSYTITALFVFLGFKYFKWFGGVKYHELNDVQKFQYQVRMPLTEAEKIDFKLVLIRLKLKYKHLQ